MILTITVTLLLATNVLLVITIGGLLKKNDQKKQFSIQTQSDFYLKMELAGIEKVQEKVEKINRLYREIEETSAELQKETFSIEHKIVSKEEVEEFVECPCCREKVLKNDNFCMHCGRDLWK